MRRLAYPYARYILTNSTIAAIGLDAKQFLEKQGFSIIKFDKENEGAGTLIIGVNKTIFEYIKQKKPMGHLKEFLLELTNFFDTDLIPWRDLDEESQRVGIEIYLWPFDKGVLMEVFVLPYMELMNRAEHCRIIHHTQEEITDWYLCEEIWDHIKPQIEQQFQTKPVIHR